MSEPAFPCVIGEDGCGPYTYVYLPNGEHAAILHSHGMTLLDYFAGRALAGMLANPAIVGRSNERLAEVAYDLGACMLKEKAKYERAG